MVTVPTPIPSTSSWQLVDFLRLTLRSNPAAGGVATLDAGQLDYDELWSLDRAVVSCDSTTATRLDLYDSAVDPMRLLDFTTAGRRNVAEWPTGLQIGPSSTLLAVWTGASNGARGYISLQGKVFRRVMS